MATQPKFDQEEVVTVALSREDFAVLEMVAKTRHTSVNDYVRGQVLEMVRAAEPGSNPSQDETISLIRAAQEEVRRNNPQNRDLVAELIAERRREAHLE